MHAPRKEVSREQMEETLRRRCHEAAQQNHVALETKKLTDSAVGQSGSHDSSSAQLVWSRPVRNADGTGYIETQCGFYTVAKAFVMGKPKYTAHRRAPDWIFTLGCRDSAAEAQALCQAFSERQ